MSLKRQLTGVQRICSSLIVFTMQQLHQTIYLLLLKVFMIGWDGPRMTGYGAFQNCTRASNFLTPRKEAYDAMLAWEGSPNGKRIKGSIMTYDQVVSDMKIAMTNGTLKYRFMHAMAFLTGSIIVMKSLIAKLAMPQRKTIL